MYIILDEIKSFLESAMNETDRILDGNTVPSGGETVSSFDAQPIGASIIVIQPKTNTGDVAAGSITINGTDALDNVITEDLTFVANDTLARYTAKFFKTVTSIVWPAQDGATATWDVGTIKAKKFYTGKVHNPPMNYLPVVMVYGDTTTLLEKSTARDRYQHQINIEVLTNAFIKVDSAEDDDKVLDAQKQIWDLFEEVDSDYTPLSTTILGALRRNITGTDYLYNDDIVIQYEQENVDGTIYYRGILTFTVDKFRNRS